MDPPLRPDYTGLITRVSNDPNMAVSGQQSVVSTYGNSKLEMSRSSVIGHRSSVLRKGGEETANVKEVFRFHAVEEGPYT